MKATLQDFFTKYPNCNKFAGDSNAFLIWGFLSDDQSIIEMIEASEAGKPALAPLAKCLEKRLCEVKNPTMTFDDKFTRQTVGMMVKAILAPFGYVVCKEKDLPKSAGAEKFQSASVYRFDPNAPSSMRLEVIKRIVEIK